MAGYVEGFVVHVPADKNEAYRAMAAMAAPIFRDHGALRVVECWGDDVPKGKTTDFWTAVKAEPGEIVVFSRIEWPSKAARDEGMAKAMRDPRMQIPPERLPFSGARMIYGGFVTLLDTAE